jgi:hypothetical protein
MATLPEVVQARRWRPFAYELRDTDLQLRPNLEILQKIRCHHGSTRHADLLREGRARTQPVL